MSRTEIIKELKNYFQIYELVGENVYNKYRENSWFLFRTETLHCLLIIRKGLDKSITVNDWFWGGIYDERGYRDNTQDILEEKTLDKVLYLSGHVLGCAFDLKIKDMSSERAREWIIKNEHLFPCKVRLEHRKNGKPISWLHFDTNTLKTIIKYIYLMFKLWIKQKDKDEEKKEKLIENHLKNLV